MKLLNNLIGKVIFGIVLLVSVAVIVFSSKNLKVSFLKYFLSFALGFGICYFFFCNNQDCNKEPVVVKEVSIVRVDTCILKSDTIDSKIETVVKKGKSSSKKIRPVDNDSTVISFDTMRLEKYIHNDSLLNNSVKISDSILVANGFIYSWYRNYQIDTIEKISYSKIVNTIVVNPEYKLKTRSISVIKPYKSIGISGFTSFNGPDMDIDYGIGLSYNSQKVSVILNKSLVHRGFNFTLALPLIRL